jgi:ParB-like chromosome segregation protein Spo0J
MADDVSDLAGGAGRPHWGRLQEIPLAAVDLADRTFALSADEGFEGLLTSLKEVGLLAPPWLRLRPDGQWQAVAGFKRLNAAAHLGWERLPARTLPAATPEAHCLLVVLYDNAFSRGFNLKEQAGWAARLLAHWDGATVAARFLPALGLPPSPAVLERLRALGSLEEAFLDLAAKGRLSLGAGAALAEMSPADRAAARPFLEQLWLSQSMQEQLLEHLTLLARREGSTPAAILERLPLKGILSEAALNPQERTKRVRRLLQRWVSPEATAAREAFQAGLERLGLFRHPRLRLSPPPAFEGPDFQLEIKFQDSQELAKLLGELTQLIKEAEFGKLTAI